MEPHEEREVSARSAAASAAVRSVVFELWIALGKKAVTRARVRAALQHALSEIERINCEEESE